MGDNKRILSIALTVLIIMNIVTLFNLRSMKSDFESRLNNMNGQISNLSNMMNSQVSSVNHILNKFTEEQKWAGNESYKLLEFDSKTGQVKVKVNWSFRELSSGSKVYLVYGEKELKTGNVEKWNRVEAAGIDNLNYMAEISLSHEKAYKLRVQSESGLGAKGEDLMDVDLNKAIKDRISVIPSMDGTKGPRYEHHVFIVNRFNGADFLRIKSAKANIYVRGNLENTVELHKASQGEIGEDMMLKFDSGTDNEIWLNDDAIWVKGEENWVQTGENSWTNNSGIELPGHDEVRVEVTIVDNMGMTHTKSFR